MFYLLDPILNEVNAMIVIDKKSNLPYYEQIYQQIKEQIITQQIPANQKLPSTRDLSADLMVSRNTVINSYSQLEVEGFIKSIGGSGYYVEQLNLPVSSSFDSFSNHVDHSIHTEHTPCKYDFQYGDLDYNCYKIKSLKKCITNAIDTLSVQQRLFYSSKEGIPELREALSHYLFLSRGVKCSPDQIIITSGHQYSLNIIAHLFSSEHWIFAMEEPGYDGTRAIFEQNKYKITPVPLETDGIAIKDLHNLKKTLLYITPSHQFPMGSVLSIAKRLSILKWAETNHGYIIEDDYDSELRYHTHSIPSLQSIDQNNRTIYLGTLSKSLSPDLRIAFVVLPKTLVSYYHEKERLSYCSVPSFLQMALAEFMISGYYQKHINTLRTYYKKKNKCILKLLEESNTDHMTLYGSDAGLHFVLSIPTHLEQPDIIEAFAKNNIQVYPTDIYWMDKKHCPKNQILVGYSSIPMKDIKNAMKLFFITLHDLSKQ